MDPIKITFPGFRSLCQGKGNTPLSNDYVIVFPLNLSDKKFSRTIYSPEMTNGRASTEEVNQALSLFELAMSGAVTKSEFSTSLRRRFLYPFLILWVFCMFIMYRSSPLLWLGFAIYCIVGICCLFRNKKTQNTRTKADSQSVLDFVQPGYLSKGLRWRIPEESYEWIELIKEYRESETSSATAVQVYPELPPLDVSVNYQYVVHEENIMKYPLIKTDGQTPN